MGRSTALLLCAALGAPVTAGADGLEARIEAALSAAGANANEIAAALAHAPADQKTAMRWLVAHMPAVDLTRVDAGFLLDNVHQAVEARRRAPWGQALPDEVFLDAVLPYASIDETREDWRAELERVFAPLVAGETSPGCAAARLNREIFAMVGVRYSTDRPKAEQSPFESIAATKASCTGLSLLLIAACRAVGVPARFVGTPLWSDGSGNHSWIEVWDDGWHYTGAAEPTGDELDRAWFTERAARARRGEPDHGIYAVTWRPSPLHFPLPWSPEDRSVPALDVTARYAASPTTSAGETTVRLAAIGPGGERVAARVRVLDQTGNLLFAGQTHGARHDANDHLVALLPRGARLRLAIEQDDGQVVERELTVAAGEQLVEIDLDR